VRRAEYAVLGAGALLFLLVCNAVPFGHYVDDVVWALLARAFVHGSALADWSFVPRLETSASWGFSALLAPVAAAGGGSLALKVWSAALFFAGTALFYAATRALLPDAARPAYLVGLFFTGFYASFSGSVISEAGYLLAFGLCAFLALEKNGLERFPARLGAATALLVLTRAVGAAFFLAAALALASRRRWRELARYAAGAALAAPYFIASKLASGSYTYHASVWTPARAASAVAANALFYFKGLALLSLVFFPSFMPNAAWLKFPAAIAVGLVAAAGARVLWRSRCGARVLLYYLGLYACVILAWPYQAPRFAVPAFPLFALLCVAGVAELAKKRARAACAALACVVVATNAGELGRTLRESLTQPVDVGHESHLWLRDHTAPGEPVVSMDIARVRWFAGRRGVHFIPSETADAFAQGARRLGARMFLLDKPAYVPPSPGLRDPLREQHDRLEEYLEHRELFRPVYRNPEEGTTVYELYGPGGSSAADASARSRP